jgi:hypothetical protein
MNYIPGVDYFVYFDLLPYSVRGMVTTNNDGTFSIYLNKRYPLSVLRKTFRHEVEHIEGEDFYNGLPIGVVEDL